MDMTYPSNLPEHDKLNLGCGYRKLHGWYNVDINAECMPDEILDLEQTPWPYPDNFFSKLAAHHVLEHVGKEPQVFLAIIKEMYRISQPQAEWHMQFYHHRCDAFYNDYTHVRSITAETFRLFDQHYNQKCIDSGMPVSAHGIQHNIDIEIARIDLGINQYWIHQVDQGLVGRTAMEQKMTNYNNVIETVNLTMLVHKPQRHTGRFDA